mmetsp:Transcript_44488/g.100443  ORF Transcript_44488/g.100443 Transcript_44488/m.100443 type:complete len:302 (-) Transcript_44488:530-1435(-)
MPCQQLVRVAVLWLFYCSGSHALHVPLRTGKRGSRLPVHAKGHTVSGVSVHAAGVVPYVEMRGRGILFLLQKMVNGTRAGKLSDFGGRREASDPDLFHTAARELTEETDGAFGDMHSLAERLRQDSSVRILNRSGRYMTFFLKVSYVEAQRLPTVDLTSEEAHARQCRWWRADELLGRVSEETLLARMVNARVDGGGQITDAERGLSSFHKAVCKTLALENAHPDAHERWHSTILSHLAASSARHARESEAAALLLEETAVACVSGSRPRRAESRRPSSRGKSRRTHARTKARPDLQHFSP